MGDKDASQPAKQSLYPQRSQRNGRGRQGSQVCTVQAIQEQRGGSGSNPHAAEKPFIVSDCSQIGTNSFINNTEQLINTLTLPCVLHAVQRCTSKERSLSTITQGEKGPPMFSVDTGLNQAHCNISRRRLQSHETRKCVL